MRKTAVVGDIHGRQGWKGVTRLVAELDEVVFLGDYMDSRVYTHQECWDNFLEVVAFKETHPDKVTLLVGNHDAAYAYPDTPPFNRCSGFDQAFARRTGTSLFFKEKGHLFRFFRAVGGVWLSHAGVQAEFGEWLMAKYLPDELSAGEGRKDAFQALESFLAQFDLSAPVPKEFGWVGRSRGGRDLCGGLLWADFADELMGYAPVPQIVGHRRIWPGQCAPGRRYARENRNLIVGADTGENGDHWHLFTLGDGKIGDLGL